MADELGTKRDSLGNVVKAGIPGFDDGKLSNNWARIVLEGGANAAIAALTGGNPAVAGASTVGGKVASISAARAIGHWSASFFDNPKAAITFGNAVDNALAGASGAAIGAAIGGASGALNGATTASIIQQFNDTPSKDVERGVIEGWLSQALATQMKRDEYREHVADATEHAFSEKEPYVADGKINTNNIPPDKYRLPTEEELRAGGIDGYVALAKMLHHPFDPNTGKNSEMNAALYFPIDPKNKHTPPLLVFQGTDFNRLKQVSEDILQYGGLDLLTKRFTGNEYTPAQKVGNFFAQSKWKNDLLLGGNSMGGGIALALSIITGLPAVATNPAAVNDNTYIYAKAKGHVDAIYMDGEFLHYLQTALFYTTAFGHLPIEGGGDIITNPIQNNFSNGMTVDLINPAKEDRSLFPNPLFHAGSRGGLLSS